VSEVDLDIKSLNEGDVFILDNGLELIQWNGKQSGIFEKRKAAETIQAMKNDRNGRPNTTVMDGVEAHPSFWGVLRADKKSWKPSADNSPPKSVAAAIPDDVKAVPIEPTLWRLSDATGKLEMTQEAKGKSNIKKNKLDQNDVFVLDTDTILFVWVGSGASKDEKTKATIMGSEYLVRQGRNPKSIAIKRELSGKESAPFWAQFS